MDLGKAFVQIMPSAKGISANISKTLEPEVKSAGKTAGTQIMTSMADSLNKAGSTLTKYITTPVLGAASAVAGIVGALGFGRLVSMDNARAKLQGLGIEGKQLEQVMLDAKTAVTGTTHTMADGVNVAAGALAAGVKEGAELERYIKLVGDAATGANAPMGEMAQIFNRIQGTGKLMGTELGMIEYRLPGFSQALAKHLGVAPEEMQNLVSAGKVTVDDFLAVMEGYAGGMAEAYAGTWMGIGKNILSNIGIIGEGILEGVFNTSKEQMGKFLTVLRESEDLKAWAKDFGETLRVAFETVIEVVKNVISWWVNLDGETKKMIGIFLGVAVAIGPVLLAISKIITTVMTLIKGFGMLKAAAGVIAGAIGSISAPVLIVIGVITGLIALFVTLYKKNEGFRDLVQTVWESIKTAISNVIQTVSDFVMEVWGGLVAWWSEHGEMILQAAQNVWNVISTVITTVMNVIWGIMQVIWPIVQSIIVGTWEAIKNTIQGAINVITGIIQFFSALFTGNWSALWDATKQILSGAVQLIWGLINLYFVGKILKLGKTFFNLFKGVFQAGWNFIRNLFSSALNAIVTRVRTEFNGIKFIVNLVMGFIRGHISTILTAIRSRFTSVFNALKGIASRAFNGVKNAVVNGIKNAYNGLINYLGRFRDAGRRIVQSIADGIKGAIGRVTDAISGVTQKVRNFLPFSPPKEGPLIDIMNVEWGPTIATGILKGENQIARAMESILAFDLTKRATFNDRRQNSDEFYKALSSQKNQPIILQIDGKTFAQVTGDYISAEGGNRIRRVERGLA